MIETSTIILRSTILILLFLRKLPNTISLSKISTNAIKRSFKVKFLTLLWRIYMNLILNYNSMFISSYLSVFELYTDNQSSPSIQDI